ncbi:class I SAM-dependent methyltransferase [Peptococcus simiae]|uniref:class I SAM-dependent methyltransferase n=1 Tax=Peptococcus simiae TaxID=1643805 RepID=UPI0039816F55
MFKRFFANVIKPTGLGGRIMVQRMNRHHESLARWGRSFLDIQPNHALLDLGCGGGRNVQYFLTRASRVYGLDYSPTSVAASRQLNQKAIRAGRCQIIEGNVRQLPFADGSMDIVTAFETIYFWEDIAACFEEVHRVLADGGQFLICNEAAHRDSETIKKWADMLGFEVYDPQTLTALLTPIGFSCDYELDYKDQLSFLAKKEPTKPL